MVFGFVNMGDESELIGRKSKFLNFSQIAQINSDSSPSLYNTGLLSLSSYR